MLNYTSSSFTQTNLTFTFSCSFRRNRKQRGNSCHRNCNHTRKNVSCKSQIHSLQIYSHVRIQSCRIDKAIAPLQRCSWNKAADSDRVERRRTCSSVLHQETHCAEASGGRKCCVWMPGWRKSKTSHYLEEEWRAAYHWIQVIQIIKYIQEKMDPLLNIWVCWLAKKWTETDINQKSIDLHVSEWNKYLIAKQNLENVGKPLLANTLGRCFCSWTHLKSDFGPLFFTETF